MLCKSHCLSRTFAFSRIWIEFLCIYQQSTVSARSAHFGALASMWEVLVGKHWDLQPRLPCLLPVQPGLFQVLCMWFLLLLWPICRRHIDLLLFVYLLKSLQSLQWICTGDTSCEEKKESDVIPLRDSIIVIGMNIHWGGWTVVPRVRERKQSSLWEEPGPGITEELEKLAEWLVPTFFVIFSYWFGQDPRPLQSVWP